MDFNNFQKANQFLTEKLITFGQSVTRAPAGGRGSGSGNYGQVVFVVGGAGSGKGFVIKNFMQGDRFKIRDVDAWKTSFLKLAEIKQRYAELKGLNLSRPADVFMLHKWIKNKQIKEKSLDLLFANATSANHLPNILFDITGKNINEISEYIRPLLNVGYQSTNIHVVWVLTNYTVAVKNNASRSRIVPDDVLLQTHEGAAVTMTEIAKGNTPKGIDGDIIVVLNNRENTLFWADANGKPIKNSRGQFIVKDFTRMYLKRAGKPIDSKDTKQQLFDWVKKNAPKTFLTKEIS